MVKRFRHIAQDLSQSKPLVYTAFSKHNFYLRMFISEYVLRQGAVPLNPFMIFDYFLLDKVDRNIIREGNNNLVMKSDEVWIFGSVSNGVLSEIQLAKKLQKTVHFFAYENNHFLEVPVNDVALEDDVSEYRHLL